MNTVQEQEAAVEDTAMTSATSLALVTSSRAASPVIWQQVLSMAPVMYESRMFGSSSPAAAAAIMLKGYELGLSFTASFEFIQVIDGKPGLSPRGALALILDSPVMDPPVIKKLTNPTGEFYGYSCTMTRKSGLTYTAKFTINDAKRAGLMKPGSGWEKYPENMCLWRAVGFAADVVAPDILNGMTGLMKMPEQYGVGLSESGDIVDVTPQPVVTRMVAPVLEISDLIERYGSDAVLAACGGVIPTDNDDLVALESKLSAGTS